MESRVIDLGPVPNREQRACNCASRRNFLGRRLSTHIHHLGMATTKFREALSSVTWQRQRSWQPPEDLALWVLGLWRFFFGISTSNRLNYKLIL